MAIEYPVGALTAALSSAKSKKRNADSNIDDDKKISLAKLFTTSNNYTEVCYQPLTTFTPSIAKKRSRKRKARDDNEIEEITVASIIMRNQQVLKDSDGKKSPQNNHTKRETKIKESGLERSSSSKKVNKHSTFKDNVEKESQTNTNKHQWNKDANEKMGIIKKKKRKPITEVSNEDHKEASVTKITNKQHLRWDEDAETNNDGSLISDPPEENVLETQSKKRRIREYDDESELLEQPVAEESDEEQVNSKKSKHSKPRGLEDPEETTRTVFVGNLPVSVELKVQ